MFVFLQCPIECNPSFSRIIGRATFITHEEYDDRLLFWFQHESIMREQNLKRDDGDRDHVFIALRIWTCRML